MVSGLGTEGLLVLYHDSSCHCSSVLEQDTPITQWYMRLEQLPLNVSIPVNFILGLVQIIIVQHRWYKHLIKNTMRSAHSDKCVHIEAFYWKIKSKGYQRSRLAKSQWFNYLCIRWRSRTCPVRHQTWTPEKECYCCSLFGQGPGCLGDSLVMDH